MLFTFFFRPTWPVTAGGLPQRITPTPLDTPRWGENPCMPLAAMPEASRTSIIFF